jgi:hypothetical protein
MPGSGGNPVHGNPDAGSACTARIRASHGNLHHRGSAAHFFHEGLPQLGGWPSLSAAGLVHIASTSSPALPRCRFGSAAGINASR